MALGGWSTGCAFGDYDGDGWLDLFVAGYVALDLERLPPSPAGALGRARPGEAGRRGEAQKGMGAAYSAGAAYCEYRGQPVMCGPRGLKGAPDHLFRNNGDGTFTDVSARAGVADAQGLFGFGVAFLDFDDDGRLDLFVANDSTPNYLYRNRGDGTFEDVSFVSGAALNETGLEQAHMGVAVGDYDHDGRDDLHITNFADDYNVLYHNDGGGSFSDVSYPAGVAHPSIPFLGWGTALPRLRQRRLARPLRGQRPRLPDRGPLRLEHVVPAAAPALPQPPRGSSWRSSGSAGRGPGPGSRPARLRGGRRRQRRGRGRARERHRRGAGAPAQRRRQPGGPLAHPASRGRSARSVVRATRSAPSCSCTAGGARQRGEVASGRSQVSQSDLRVHFGLGATTRVERLEVRWANGPTCPVRGPGRRPGARHRSVARGRRSAGATFRRSAMRLVLGLVVVVAPTVALWPSATSRKYLAETPAVQAPARPGVSPAPPRRRSSSARAWRAMRCRPPTSCLARPGRRWPTRWRA